MRLKIHAILMFISLIIIFISIYIAGFAELVSFKEGALFVVLIFAIVAGLLSFAFYYLEQENAKEKKEFLDVINHIFRTPLTEINWTIDGLQEDFISVEQKQSVEKIKVSTKRLLDIFEALQGLQSFDQKGAYSFQAVAFHEILEKSIQKYKSEINTKKIQLQLNFDSELPLITVDTKKIQFVLEVLIENAVKYSKEGSLIKIDLNKVDNMVEVLVSDTGIGLDKGFKYNLFRQFYRGEKARTAFPNGMGLGLFLANKVVKQHKGNLEIKSADKGTKAILKLPLNLKR